MKISVIGCGYLGAVHAACLAKLGHDVVGIDVDEPKVAALREGRAPFFEPGLPELLAEVSETGRLAFSSDIADAAGARVHFICVGTPQAQGDFRADLGTSTRRRAPCGRSCGRVTSWGASPPCRWARPNG